MDMKLKEFFVANVVPLQKELTTEKQETAMKTKELEYNLTTYGGSWSAGLRSPRWDV